MNGYEMMANSYRKILESDREKMSDTATKDIERKIRILELLAEFETEDKYIAFDSSMFNNIFNGYVKKIIDELCNDEKEDIREAAQKIRGRIYGRSSTILDSMSAKEAEVYYLNN